MTRVVVLAWGKESRGDDALGPLFLEAVEAIARCDGGRPHFVCGGLCCCLFAGWPDDSACSVRV